MSSSWHSTRTSLDNSLVLPCESLEKLRAVKPVNLAEVIKQVKLAAESAQNLRALISAEMPEASWQNREELDILIETIQRNIEQRTLRSRLTSLVAELERGNIVHRRASRVDQLNQLRDQAISELRAQAEARGDATNPTRPRSRPVDPVGV